MRKNPRLPIAVVAAAIGLAAVPGSALASNHLVKIREVYAGSAAAPGSEYVELQMYAPGQNLFNYGTAVKLYDASGTLTETFTPTGSNPPNSQSQRRVLLASSGAQAQFGVSAGYTLAGANAIANGSAISRSISGGCSTLLESGDDTNRPTDWSDVTPAPLSNAATPPEQSCPSTTITKQPKKRTTDRTPTFKFRASVSGSTFECRVDRGKPRSCGSPFTSRKLAKGSHTFQVRATNSGGGVGATARASFTVIKKTPHHRR